MAKVSNRKGLKRSDLSADSISDRLIAFAKWLVDLVIRPLRAFVANEGA
ncbi:hypothetical protein [Stieleria marina]|uniref:Uncharacterized protein n=1 Tax=Stieleria marina TaxID=1930275 RepID=A0A517NUQ6_9BACT|nr:hypothetical protein K239x_28500 [Planctomycetes bacterium K23_9]